MTIYLCPSDRKLACSWEGNAEDILEHFQQEHDLLLYFDNNFTIDLNITSENRLFFLDEEIYLLQNKISDKKLVIKLRYLGPRPLATRINYNVEFRVGTDRYRNNIIVNSEGGIELDLESLKFFEGEVDDIYCTLNVTKRFADSSVSPDEGVFFDDTNKSAETDAHRKTPDNKTVVNPKEIVDSSEVPEVHFTKTDDNLLFSKKTTKKCVRSHTITIDAMMLKSSVKRTKSTISLGSIQETASTSDCSNCSRFLIPPIYLCPCRQNFCYECRFEICKQCNEQVTQERNIDFEDKYKKFLIPCKNSRYGCPEKILYNNLLDHEVNCLFCVYRCPSEGCHFETQFKGMVQHLKIIHGSTKLFESCAILLHNLSEAFVVSEERGVFYCCVKQTNDSVICDVIPAGPKEKRYFCEVKFKDAKHEPFFLSKIDGTYSITLSMQNLKKRKLKLKNAILTIAC